MPTPDPIRTDSARLRRVLTVLWCALLATLVLERFGNVALQLYRDGLAGAAWRHLGVAFVSACPELLYLLALWWVRAALAGFARGELYAPTISRMLDRVGVALAVGAAIAVFVVPSAAKALGYGPGYVIAFDVSGMVLGAIGLSLKVIARVFRRAAAMQAELEGIF